MAGGVAEVREPGDEFAGDEGIEGTETAGEFRRGDVALAVKPAKKIGSRATTFLGVAFNAAGDEVAVGIVLELDARNDVVEATHSGREATATIKAEAAFALVDGFAQGAVLEEVEFVEAAGNMAAGNPTGADSANLRGKAHVDDMADFAAFDEAQEPAGDETADGPAHGVVSETGTASEPRDRETDAKLPFEAAVTEEMRIDNAIGDGETETRGKKVLALFPEAFGIGFDFHECNPEVS